MILQIEILNSLSLFLSYGSSANAFPAKGGFLKYKKSGNYVASFPTIKGKVQTVNEMESIWVYSTNASKIMYLHIILSLFSCF